MAINSRIFKGVLLLVTILVIVGYSLVIYFRLDQPVFFDHYYDKRIYINEEQYQEISFNLSYITNVHDDRVVTQITFPEHPEVTIQASEYAYNAPFNWGSEKNKTPGDVYGRYSVRNVICKMIELPQKEDLNKIVLTHAKVLFDDASEITVDIGEINLYAYMPGEIPLEHVSTSGSSDGTGETRYRLLGNLTLTAIDSPLMANVKDSVQWEINNNIPNDSLGMTFQEGSFLDVTSRIGSMTGDIISEYTLFDIHPKLTFVDDAGIQYTQHFYNIDSLYHNYSFMTLYKYIKARGAI
jgi:hypothetical protein